VVENMSIMLRCWMVFMTELVQQKS